MSKSILDFWPMEEYDPRPQQIQALQWLEKQTAKYIILQSPVGSGKSLIALTYSRWLNQGSGDSYILTTQKILQKQYADEFRTKNLVSIYGRANYECKQLNTTCNIGKILKSCNGCQYTKLIKTAKNSSNLVFNYTHAFLMFAYLQELFPPRELLVFDEAHNLESHLVTHKSVNISRKKALEFQVKMPYFKDIVEAFKWLKDRYLPTGTDILNEMLYDVERVQGKSGKLSKIDAQTVKAYEILDGHLATIREFISDYNKDYQTKFILVKDENSISFKPVYGSDNFYKWCEPQAERFLFMSSTIINHKSFSKDLGLPIEDVAYLELDSDFPEESRSTVFINGLKMNASWHKPENEKCRNIHIETIKTILDLHEGESGILHTGNFKIAEWIVSELKDLKGWNIYHHNPDTNNPRDSVIKAFLSDPKPSILISPSITTGLDLKNELGRFCIISKIAFQNLGDAWVKKRLELSQQWYNNEAVKSTIQAGGRIVRSKEDYGTTYIIDGSFQYFYQQNISNFPKWWRNAFSSL